MIFGYVARRMLAAPKRLLPGALAIAVALAGFIVAIVAPTLAGDIAMRAELRALPVVDRLVTVVDPDRSTSIDPSVDVAIRAALRTRSFAGVVRQTALRQLAAPSGTVFRIVGVDDLARLVTLRAGRLPTRCDADGCEAVLWLRPTSPTSVELDPAFRLSIVGAVDRVDERLLAGNFAPETHEAVIFVDGATAVAGIRALELIQRTTGWVSELDPAGLSVADVPRFLSDLASLTDVHPGARFVVSAPESAVRSIAVRARVTARRLVMPVGQAGALLGGFSILMTLAVRPWHRRGRRVLQLRAASRRQEFWFTCVEAAWLVSAGALAGLAIAAVGLVVLATRARLPVQSAVDRVTESGPVLALGGLGIGYLVMTIALLRATPDRPARWRRVRAGDVIGVASVAVWLLAAARGRASADDLVSGNDPLLALTPALAGLAAACLVARIHPLLGAALRQLTSRRRWPTRLALGAPFGQPGRPLATASFVAAALTLATFALGYRSTLEVGAVDQAAFAVPLDFSLRQARALVRPGAVASVNEWTALPDVVATEIVRRGLAVRISGSTAETVEVLGLDPSVLSDLRGWRDGFGTRPTAAQLNVAPSAGSAAQVPSGSRELTVAVEGSPPNLGLAAILERSDGTWHETTMKSSEGGSSWSAVLENDDVGFHGFRLGESSESSTHVLHNVGEGAGTDVASLGIAVRLGTLTIDGRPVVTDWTTLTGPEVRVRNLEGVVTLETVVHASSSLVLFGEPERPLPAIVDLATASAARDGVVVLGTGRSSIELVVVGTATRFATVGERFAIIDGRALARQLNRVQPGSGASDEMWVGARTDQARADLTARLGAERFASLDVADRVTVESTLARDTLGRAVTATFLWSSFVAAAFAAISMWVLANSDLLDGLPVLRSLVADGATGRQLASILVLRTGSMLLTAVPVGVAFGLGLLSAVQSLISVSAAGTAPVPPLRTVVVAWQLTASVAAVSVLALAGTWWVARRVRTIGRRDALVVHS